MFLRWFFSPAYRQAFSARRQYVRLLSARRDGLPPEGVAAVRVAVAALEEAMAEGHSGRMRIKAEELQFAANQWISPYPTRAGRILVEIFLVAMVLALAIRTFFVQPFNIPTGSMEPTLYGVNYVNLLNHPGLQAPTGWRRMAAWFQGFSYVESLAQANGTVNPQRIGPVKRFLGFNLWQTYWIGDTEEKVWFPPNLGDSYNGIAPLIRPHRLFFYFYRIGNYVINLRRQCGDYLLADRLTYNFRKPLRGEIVVFKTGGISLDERVHYNIPEGEFYLKRLVGLPGERVQIGDDRHLIINGRRLDATTPHFAKVYGFDPNQPPAAQQYSGHLNAWTAQQFGLHSDFTPEFPNAETVYTNDPGACLVMGDNTVDSLDSRYWGAITEDAVVGKCWFVFWPFTERFGWQKDR